jgi:hypothetical protein
VVASAVVTSAAFLSLEQAPAPADNDSTASAVSARLVFIWSPLDVFGGT